MGLTVHYSLKSNTLDVKEAYSLFEKLRQKALDLPFTEVGDIKEYKGKECIATDDDSAGVRWLKIQLTRYVSGKKLIPTHIIAFTVIIGNGCENANFALCLYPGENQFSWDSFCKTQYASNPEYGGIANFLRCHMSLIFLLDYAKKLGILDKVDDESNYWNDRDIGKLIKEIGHWNSFVAGFTGIIKDLMCAGKTVNVISEISKFPNFEHLEASFVKNPETVDYLKQQFNALIVQITAKVKPII